MFRFHRLVLPLIACVSTASAHFVFVVPDKNDRTAQVILSEDLTADDQIPVETIVGSQLVFTDRSGHDTPLKLSKSEHACTIDLPSGTPGVVHGIDDLGVIKRGKPSLLSYFPKTIVGDPFDAHGNLEDKTPIELRVRGAAGQFKLQVCVSGKPVAGAEINLILPDGSTDKVVADVEGCSRVLRASGRYGAWARNVEATAGELNGHHYDDIRHYATLVIDVPGAGLPGPATLPAPLKGPTASSSSYAPLPQPVSSFGAVACDSWLYVYGGHTANTHSYSTASVSGQFHRLNLVDHRTWETLDGGPPLQGMNLATWHGKIFRIGGMCPHNKVGEKSDVRSVADCASFDPASGKWSSLTPLPEPRSSHDVVVIGDKLIVVGGWNLSGTAGEASWPDSALMLDLASPNSQWKAVKQPFHRRALIAAAFGGRVYVLGGFESELEPNRAVEIYDPAKDTWTHGPKLPGADKNGFGPAACVLGDRLYVSVADGNLYRLNAAGADWEKVAITTPRIVHRLAPNGSDLIVMGGAMKQRQVDLIEAVTVSN